MGKSAIAVLVLLVFAVTGGVADGGFVLDAERVVAANPLIEQGSFTELVSTHWWSASPEVGATLYRPLPLLWFAWLGRIGDGRNDAGVFHKGSLFLHVACALARYFLVLLLIPANTRRYVIALFAALIPAVHAVATESVACMVGSAEILTALFMTLSWCSFISGWRGRGPLEGGLWLFSAAALWLFALLSKETSVLFPLVLLAQAWVLSADEQRAPKFGLLLMTGLLFVAAAAGWWMLRARVLGGAGLSFATGPYAEFSTTERLRSAFAVVGSSYLRAIVWPFDLMPNLTHQDVPPPTSWLQPAVLTGMVSMVVLVGAMTASLARKATTGVLLACLLFTFLPVSNLLLGIGTVGGYRLMYTPIFALVAALAIASGTSLRGRLAGKALTALLGVLLLLGAAGSFPLIEAWHDGRSLAHYAWSVNPRSVWALENRIAADHTTGNGPVDFGKFVADFRDFDVIEPELASLPGRERLDHDSRVICHRINMQRSSAEGTLATMLNEPAAALEGVQRGIRAAQKAEEYGWGDDNRVFDARLAAFRLRLVALDRAQRESDKKEAAVVAQEIEEDLVILEELARQSIANDRLLAYLFEASRYAQLQRKPDLVDYFVARGMTIDRQHPKLATMKAQRLREQRNAKEAYLVLQPVVEGGRGGIEEHFLLALICSETGRAQERLRYLRAASRLAPQNENEVQLLQRIARMLGG